MKRLLVIVLTLLITGCSQTNIFKNAVVNNNELVIKEQVIGNLKFSDTSLIYEKGISTFKVTILNMGDKVNPESVSVVFKNENDTIITTLDGTFGEIDKDSLINLTLTSDIDLSNAYKVEYIIK
ncbi:MAG: hypothetical protein IJ715_02410 [Bacilli bacterium]|nr:hypothetical protein [Bacilli bacterium]